MKVALTHYRLGETDGVSLEMEKWRTVLERMGHTVIFISGTKDYGEYTINELDYHSPEFIKWTTNSFKTMTDYNDEEAFQEDILKQSRSIARQLSVIIEKEAVSVMVNNNIFSLGVCLPGALGFYRALHEKRVLSFNHNHDFYWDRPHMSRPTCDFVRGTLERFYPPHESNHHQLVINSISQQDLKQRKGLDSDIVPNVFDFQGSAWVKDDYNADLRQRLGISENDLIFLHATRIEKRKAIELAIETVGHIQERRDQLNGRLYDGRVFGPDQQIVMLLPGLIEIGPAYTDFLKDVAHKNGVKLIWADQLFKAKREIIEGQKHYALWDAYAIADMITYTSTFEGWGNQYLEGLFAKKPMIVYEYSVFRSDIAKYGFKNISLGSNHTMRNTPYGEYAQVNEKVLKQAAEQAIKLLKDSEAYRDMVNTNFEIGRRWFSLEALEAILQEIISKKPEAFFTGKHIKATF